MTFHQKIAISTGNTLLCLLLTEDEPIRPHIFECNTVEEAFLHFKPSCTINFINHDRSIVTETLHFNSFADFGITALCTNSTTLSDLVNTTILYFENTHVSTQCTFPEKIDFMLEYAEMAEESELTASLLLLKRNLLAAVKVTSSREKHYHELELFLKNRMPGAKALVLNASYDQLSDLDNTRFIDFIAYTLSDNIDRLDVRNAISCLVVPGIFNSFKIASKFARICERNRVVLFTDLSQDDNMLTDLSPFNPKIRYLNFSDCYFANICLTEDQLYIEPNYSFLKNITSKVSLSPALAAFAPTFIAGDRPIEINLEYENSVVRIIKNSGGYKSFFKSFSVEKINGRFVIAGSDTIYQGNIDFLKNIKNVLFAYWLLKRFSQLMNITLFNQMEISPPGNLHDLHHVFPDKISFDFYSLCRERNDINGSNIEWLSVMPDWFKMVSESYGNAYLWPVCFTLVIKLKERIIVDSLLLMYVTVDDGGYHVTYEEICDDDLINFTQELQPAY